MSSPDDYRQAYIEAIRAASEAFIEAEKAANAARDIACAEYTAAMCAAVVARENAIAAANAAMCAAANAEHHRKIVQRIKE